MEWFIQEQRKCKLCHSALVAFYTLFAFPDNIRSSRVSSMEGERGRLEPAATAGRASMQTGRQRWVTAQGKASDQHLRFMTEDIWGKSVEHTGQIQKKSQKLSFSHCSYQHPAVQHLHHVTWQGRGYTAAWALSLPAQLQPGLGRVWVLIAWHCTKQQETGRFQLKRKMRNTPQRWPLNKERHLNF